MSEIVTVDNPFAEERWALLAIARDAQTAEQWQDALDDDEITSEVRIEDSALVGRSSTMPHTNAAIGHELFAYSVWVPAEEREAAAKTLIDAGWDGNYGQGDNTISSGFALRGALLALGVGILLIIVRLVRT